MCDTCMTASKEQGPDTLACVHAGRLDGLRLAVSHCKVEPLVHPCDIRQPRQASAGTQRTLKAPSRTSSASEEDLSRGRHASWQELPPELVALIFQHACIRERKLCGSPPQSTDTSGSASTSHECSAQQHDESHRIPMCGPCAPPCTTTGCLSAFVFPGTCRGHPGMAVPGKSSAFCKSVHHPHN